MRMTPHQLRAGLKGTCAVSGLAYVGASSRKGSDSASLADSDPRGEKFKMRRATCACIFCLLIFARSLTSAPSALVRHIDFSVENRADYPFQGVAWIDAADVYKLIPDFDGFSFIVTTTNSPDLATDLRKLRAYELPSQALDINRPSIENSATPCCSTLIEEPFGNPTRLPMVTTLHGSRSASSER